MSTPFDFPYISAKQWKNSIQFQLDGEDYATLIKKTTDQVSIKPFYHPDEDFHTLNWKINTQLSLCFPLFFHPERNFSIDASEFNYSQNISWHFSSKLSLIENTFSLPKDIHQQFVFFNKYDENSVISFYKKYSSSNIHLAYDPIYHLAKEGNFYDNYKNDIKLYKTISTQFSKFFSLFIDTTIYAQSGATDVQQIAFSLAHLNEYLTIIPNFEGKIIIKWAIGTDFWVETAKFQAFEYLLQILLAEYSTNCSYEFFTTASNRWTCNINSEWNELALNNALQIAHTINSSFHEIRTANQKSKRDFNENKIAYNRSKKMLDEWSLPTTNTLFTNSLSVQLAEKSWELFKKIERNDGLISQLFKGTIQKSIAEAELKSTEKFLNNNKEYFISFEPIAKEYIQNHTMYFKKILSKNIRKTKIRPIIEKNVWTPFYRNIFYKK
ncbi:methylmalonyl-CoA mutase family protein [Capnocytophaga sp. ARDL2]|uniref:methylmalonyl-CoA mutase family protein n=1 Tax=Capnocytophaga sp. ARDL2 TaxID=3238809 RepID=UPI0035577D43